MIDDYVTLQQAVDDNPNDDTALRALIDLCVEREYVWEEAVYRVELGNRLVGNNRQRQRSITKTILELGMGGVKALLSVDLEETMQKEAD